MAPSTDPKYPAVEGLQTEALSPLARTMDTMDTFSLCKSFNDEESRVSGAVAQCLPTIAALVEALVPRLRAGGRLIYLGAGNSGRVAHMDCAELPVTFSADPNKFLAVVAGGTQAVVQAVEGAEDSHADGMARMHELDLTSQDIVIGISASGRTPFVLGALEVAIRHHCLTAAIANARPSHLDSLNVTHHISVLVGPEFISGSTRLKAGSCAKQILNMISSCSMVQLGKTYGGLMVDVRTRNEKLRIRGRNIVRKVCAGVSASENSHQNFSINDRIGGDAFVDELITRCGGRIKLACAVGLSGLDPDKAEERLTAVDGRLSSFLEALRQTSTADVNGQSQVENYFLCIDGGGTNCIASIASHGGVLARAVAGSCNLHSVPLEGVVSEIRCATLKAAALLPGHNHPGRLPVFTRVWAGIAGVRHIGQMEALTSRLEELLCVSFRSGSLQITCDVSLLSSRISIDNEVRGGIALVAGTGAVATAFKKTNTNDVAQVGRTGGWGHLIGDQGSAFYIGRRAVQEVLATLEQNQGKADDQPNELGAAILKHLDCDAAGLLSRILRTDGQAPRLTIGRIARVVTELGFRPVNPSEPALAILHEAAGCLAGLVKNLSADRICNVGESMLVLSGALMNLEPYRDLVLQKCTQQGLIFRKTVVVQDVSATAAQYLAQSSPAASNRCTEQLITDFKSGMDLTNHALDEEISTAGLTAEECPLIAVNFLETKRRSPSAQSERTPSILEQH